jgi:hypothetical protein
MLANQIQHDPAVDVANRFTGCHLKVVQVDLAHKTKNVRRCSVKGFQSTISQTSYPGNGPKRGDVQKPCGHADFTAGAGAGLAIQFEAADTPG